MTAVIPDILQQAAFNTLAGFIASLVDCPVLRSQVNRVSMPSGSVIYITPTGASALAVSVDSFTATTQNVRRSTQLDYQVDCYGAGAADRAQTIVTLLRDGYACDQFAAANPAVQPLYAGDTRQIPLIDGEEQYVERWTFDAVLQVKPTVSVPIQSMTAAQVGLINVDRTYPPA